MTASNALTATVTAAQVAAVVLPQAALIGAPGPVVRALAGLLAERVEPQRPKLQCLGLTEPGGPSPIVALEWDRAEIAGETGAPGLATRPDIAFLAWDMVESDQPLEMLVPTIQWGKRLAQLGFNLLVGPSPVAERGGDFGADPRLVARTFPVFLDGLRAAGLEHCAGGFDPAKMEPTWPDGPGLGFAAGLAKGLAAITVAGDAVRRDGLAGLGLGSVLREQAGFTGVALAPSILADDNAGQALADALEADFDLMPLVESEPASDSGRDRLEDLLQEAAGEIEARGLEGRLRQAAARVLVLRDHL